MAKLNKFLTHDEAIEVDKLGVDSSKEVLELTVRELSTIGQVFFSDHQNRKGAVLVSGAVMILSHAADKINLELFK